MSNTFGHDNPFIRFTCPIHQHLLSVITFSLTLVQEKANDKTLKTKKTPRGSVTTNVLVSLVCLISFSFTGPPQINLLSIYV